MSGITYHKEPSENIDFFDIFVVLVKYKRLFMSVFLLSIFIVALGYFFYPSWKYNKTPATFTTRTICRVYPGPAIHAVDIKYDLTHFFRSSTLILEAMREAGYETVGDIELNDPESLDRLLYFIEHQYLPNLLTIVDENRKEHPDYYKSSEQVIKIYYNYNDTEKAEKFLNALFVRVNNNVCKMLSNFPEVEINNTSDALILYEKPYTIVNETKTPMDQIKADYIRKSSLILISILFLSIFISFFWELISSIKKDEDRMAKLRKVMRKE